MKSSAFCYLIPTLFHPWAAFSCCYVMSGTLKLCQRANKPISSFQVPSTIQCCAASRVPRSLLKSPFFNSSRTRITSPHGTVNLSRIKRLTCLLQFVGVRLQNPVRTDWLCYLGFLPVSKGFSVIGLIFLSLPRGAEDQNPIGRRRWGTSPSASVAKML